jgi:hypothetical protein
VTKPLSGARATSQNHHFFRFIKEKYKKVHKIFNQKYRHFLNHMLCDLFPRLTLRLMGLGLSLREAERVAASVMTWVVIVVTIMGYTIRREPDGIPAGRWLWLPSAPSGISALPVGSQICGFEIIAADAGMRSPALLTA